MNGNEPAGFWIRLGAMLLDGLIIGLPLSLLGMMVTGMPWEDEALSDFVMFLYTLLVPILWNGYTVGKRICGIRIAKIDGDPPGLGTMLMRNIVAGIVYGLTIGIGIIVSAIMVGVREDKRSLHDFIAGTEVVRD
ncbi:RDD family protein [Paenibacillus tarimensis]|uniref:RDD family protein n=1 Tax=Paenibacillus tarimensis TaxID=416012 RepID=UPI001F337C38|nr:RDD family protein [Paenibacillus tarimensis]MCF2943372.1 RDD family protein [Paenibacillus tarimensis]